MHALRAYFFTIPEQRKYADIKKKRVKNYQKKHNRKKRLNKQRGGYWYGISPWYAHEDDEDNKQRGGYYRKRKTRQRGGRKTYLT